MNLIKLNIKNIRLAVCFLGVLFLFSSCSIFSRDENSVAENKYVLEHDKGWQNASKTEILQGDVREDVSRADANKTVNNTSSQNTQTIPSNTASNVLPNTLQGVKNLNNDEKTARLIKNLPTTPPSPFIQNYSEAKRNENALNQGNINLENTKQENINQENDDREYFNIESDKEAYSENGRAKEVSLQNSPKSNVSKSSIISATENQANVDLSKKIEKKDYTSEIKARELASKIQIEKMREIAKQDMNKYFVKDKDGKVTSPSIPKGIFTIRNTNFITVGEAGDVWLWSSNLQNRNLIEMLGTCVDKVDFDHNTLSIFWSCGAKLYTKELLAKETTQQINGIKTRAASFSVYNNASQFIVGGADGKLYRWEDKEGMNITDFVDFERYTAHASVVSAVAFHPAGRVFFSGDWQGRFKAWLSYKEDEFGGEYDENLFGGRFFEDGSTVKDSGRAGGSIEKIEVSPKGDFILLGLQDSSIELWKLRSFKKVLNVKASNIRLLDIKFYDDSSFITLSKDNIARLWGYDETEDEIGEERIFKSTEIRREVLSDTPVALYVARDKRILYANQSGDLKEITFSEKPINNQIENIGQDVSTDNSPKPKVGAISDEMLKKIPKGAPASPIGNF